MSRIRVALAAAGLSLWLTACGAGAPAPNLPVAASAAPTSAAIRPVVVGAPVLVTIPKLGATDDIIPVGLASDGGLELPDVSQTGWFRLGVKPGEPGPSLLASHVNYGGVAGALGRIGELRSGDIVVVKDTAGIERIFGVYDVQTIPKVDYTRRTVPLVFGPRHTSDLELVTCGGRIVGHEYDSNVVVSARLAA